MKCLTQTSAFPALYWNHLSNEDFTRVPRTDCITDSSPYRLVLLWELISVLSFSLATS